MVQDLLYTFAFDGYGGIFPSSSIKYCAKEKWNNVTFFEPAFTPLGIRCLLNGSPEVLLPDPQLGGGRREPAGHQREEVKV